MQRTAFIVFAILLILPVSGALLQGVASALDRMKIEPPDEFITVSGTRLHVFCSGPMDAPPVFLETGMGVVSDAWARVQENLALDHRVCRYDRAGTGHSDRFD